MTSRSSIRSPLSLPNSSNSRMLVSIHHHEGNPFFTVAAFLHRLFFRDDAHLRPVHVDVLAAAAGEALCALFPLVPLRPVLATGNLWHPLPDPGPGQYS